MSAYNESFDRGVKVAENELASLTPIKRRNRIKKWLALEHRAPFSTDRAFSDGYAVTMANAAHAAGLLNDSELNELNEEGP